MNFEISLNPVVPTKQLCGFVISSSSGAKYTLANDYTRFDVESNKLVPYVPVIRGFFVPLPKNYVLASYALEEGESPESTLNSRDLSEYDATAIFHKLLKRSSNLLSIFGTIPEFMLDFRHNFYGKGWVPLKTKTGSFLPPNETGVLIYRV